MKQECEWASYVREGFGLAEFPPGARVLDLGCGSGLQLGDLAAHETFPVGIDLDWAALGECRARRLRVVRGRAEEIPIRASSMDGLLCKVVLPYTEEAHVFGEISRVLRRDAVAYCVYHGAGYYLRYALYRHHWKYRIYGLRTLLNTWWYAVSGRRLPGFLGDTLYQSPRRLAAYYALNHLQLLAQAPAPTYLGYPVFIYHALRKVGP